MASCMDVLKLPAGAVVLDPYMGSGSTIIAAIRTGRKAIGIEKDPEHFERAANESAPNSPTIYFMGRTSSPPTPDRGPGRTRG